MRLATYNVESMFERPKAMNLPTWDDGKSVLEDFTRLNQLIGKPIYSAAVKQDLLDTMGKYKGLISTGKSEFIRLQEIRGKLLKAKPPEIVAEGHGAWIGWFELEKAPVKETATENTARIIGRLNADVLCVVEAENRICLKHFNDGVLPVVGVEPFCHVMLIDGNDDRGIDVGIMAKAAHELVRIRTHVDDTDDKGTIFSRDCAEYEIRTARGNTLLIMVNHFKSKGYGAAAKSAEKRLRQATRVRAIYEERIREGYQYIAIGGDLNEVPPDGNSNPLDPLLSQGSTLTDIMAHPYYTSDGRPGTHGNGTKSGKFDYILMSPMLCRAVTAGGIERLGVWGGKNGTLFPHLQTINGPLDAASDHAALWLEADV